jgi:hypothetical protein
MCGAKSCTAARQYPSSEAKSAAVWENSSAVFERFFALLEALKENVTGKDVRKHCHHIS